MINGDAGRQLLFLRPLQMWYNSWVGQYIQIQSCAIHQILIQIKILVSNDNNNKIIDNQTIILPHLVSQFCSCFTLFFSIYLFFNMSFSWIIYKSSRKYTVKKTHFCLKFSKLCFVFFYGPINMQEIAVYRTFRCT